LSDLTLFAAATHVSRFQQQEKGKGKTMNDTCGPMSERPLAIFDHGTQSWKMYGVISLWGDSPLLENLPPSGMTRNGGLFPQPAWVRITDATESSLWPTPTVDDSKNVNPKGNRRPGLVSAVREALGNPSIGGKLNPTWVEWLMGFPEGWTDLQG
jgi:hypothetical protein